MQLNLHSTLINFIAGKQRYQCNNHPNSELPYLESYSCPLWATENESRGNFDESGYKITTIGDLAENEYNVDNLQALCIMCHEVKMLYYIHTTKTPSNDKIDTFNLLAKICVKVKQLKSQCSVAEKLYNKKNISKYFEEFDDLNMIDNVVKCNLGKYVGNNTWWTFNGVRWVIKETCIVEYNFWKCVKDMILTFVDEYSFDTKSEDKIELIDDLTVMINNSDDTFEEYSDLCYDKNFVGKLDENPKLIGFNNGVYDLKQMKFRECVPDDMVSLSVGYDYCERVNGTALLELNRLLSQWHSDNSALKYLMAVFAGYLGGELNPECVFTWLGCGNNGKSCALKLLSLVFGEYYINISSEMNILNSTLIKGRKIAVCQEMENHSDMVNSIESYILAIFGERHCVDDIIFKPSVNFLMMSNNLSSNMSSGFARRHKVIPWLNTFNSNMTYNAYGQNYLRNTDLMEQLISFKEVFMWCLLNEHYPTHKNVLLKIPDPIQMWQKGFPAKKNHL